MASTPRALLFILVLTGFGAACRGPADLAKAEVDRIAEDAWQHALEREVYLRVKHGLVVDHLPGLTMEEARGEAEWAAGLLKRIKAVEVTDLDHFDRQTLELLGLRSKNTIDALQHYWNAFVVTPYVAGSLLQYPHQAFAAFRLEEESHLDDYLSLVKDYAGLVRQMEEKLRGQDKLEIRLPKSEIPLVVGLFSGFRGQLDQLVGVSPQRLGAFDPKMVESFRSRLEKALAKRVRTAYDDVLEFLQGDYLDRAPRAVGYSQYPGGPAYYSFLVEYHTGLPLTPGQIHGNGLRAVEGLEKRMEEIRSELGFTGTKTEFHDQLRKDPRFLARTPQEVESRYRTYIERIEPLIGDYFSRLPEAPYGVQRLDAASEGAMTFGYYQAPTAESPKGLYRYNGSQLEDRPLLTAGPLIYHELIPGHHLQIASQNEMVRLPPIRRESLDSTAFVEGWGNYAAYLASEMNLLDDPYDQYGLALFDMFISVRLVVDTGMNALGWTLEQGREYMKEHTFTSEAEIRTETLRYSVDLPGQALAYKIGLEKILELREKARDSLGDRFEIREFHQALLGSGALPLSILEKHIDWFIETKKAASRESALAPEPRGTSER